MIVFNLICKICSTEFEGWFESAKEFDKQKRKKIINCPYCNSSSVKKSLMTPNLPVKSNSKKETKLKKAVANNIKKYRKIVEKNFDYVGDQFAEEAKRIHQATFEVEEIPDGQPN